MNSKDTFKPVGTFYLKVYENDILIEEYQDKNLIVTTGRAAITKLLATAANSYIVDQIGFGSNSSLPLITDTALTDEFKKSFSGVVYPTIGSVRFDWTLEAGENNGATIREFALIHNDNNLFARKVRAPITKDNTIRLEGSWTINF